VKLPESTRVHRFVVSLAEHRSPALGSWGDRRKPVQEIGTVAAQDVSAWIQGCGPHVQVAAAFGMILDRSERRL
jgi:hypothetical protein